MKIGGKKIDSRPASDILVFPRADGDLAFRANAVMDRAIFDKICPVPKLPKKTLKGGKRVDDYEHPNAKILLEQHSQKYMNWMFLTSLCAVVKETQEDIPIEWEKVDIADPSTYHLYEEELKEAGLSDMERKRLMVLVNEANSLSDSKLDEARASFLVPVVEEVDQSSFHLSEQSDTPSGEPVKDSESSLQA